MIKAIFYKEWIKTRYFLFAVFIFSWSTTGYCLMKMDRVIRLKGSTHLWQIMLERDVVFIDFLQYIPLITGLSFALVQFIPEWQQNRLKLTLHLPFSSYRMIGIMLGYGVSWLTTIFFTDFLLCSSVLSGWLPRELGLRLFFTALPWYLGGTAAYLLTAWICLEPAWKRRIWNLVVSAGVLRLFFLSSVPEAYNRFLPLLIIYIPFISLLSLLSIRRFKAGVQD